MYQTLIYIELERVPVNQAPYGNKDITILRSKEKIPKLVSDINAELLLSVNTLDGEKQFSVNEFSTVGYYDGAKYTGNTSRAYIMDSYIHLRGKESLKGVSMQGIFEDPVEVYLFNLPYYDCVDCKCKPAEEIEFPIDRDLMRTTLELAQQELIIMFSQMIEDISANTIDDASSKRGQMIHQPRTNPVPQ
jgi:hypothetical protein